MKFAPALLALVLGAGAAPLAATPGDIATLRIGTYVCALPGDATGPAARRVPAADFSITNASSYSADGGSGNYLLIGDSLQMTSGPRKGQRYRRVSVGMLRQLGPDGQDTALRCVRLTRNNE